MGAFDFLVKPITPEKLKEAFNLSTTKLVKYLKKY
jgi:response regulator of citrate/malate metabolism